MAKKKHLKRIAPKPAQAAPPQPVMQGNTFATFLLEAQSIGNECEARRKFDALIAEWLTMKGLVDEFEAWRKAKMQPPTDGPARPEPGRVV